MRIQNRLVAAACCQGAFVIVLKKDEVPFQRKQRRFFVRFSKNNEICGETDLSPVYLNRISREDCPRPWTFDMVSSGVAIAEAETFGHLHFEVFAFSSSDSKMIKFFSSRAIVFASALVNLVTRGLESGQTLCFASYSWATSETRRSLVLCLTRLYLWAVFAFCRIVRLKKASARVEDHGSAVGCRGLPMQRALNKCSITLCDAHKADHSLS